MTKENNKILESFLKLSADSLDPSLILSIMQLIKSHKPSSENTKGRWQDQIILNEIPNNSSVLDLGCGEGELLNALIKQNNVKGQGVEINTEAVLKCIDLGVPVFNINLDEGLLDFPTKSFDYVVLESTLQTLNNPIFILEEMLRVAHKGIISFPNFGYWRVRSALALGGRMPVTKDLPYGWYDTPNIHLFTLNDFLDWAKKNNITITKSLSLTEDEVIPINENSNLAAEEILIFLEKNKNKNKRGNND